MKHRLLAAAASLFLAMSGSAQAQIIVYDPTSFAKLLQQTQTALNQLQQLERRVQQGEQQIQQGEQLLTSLNQISNVNTLATSLSQPALRNFLPDANAFVSAATTAQSDLAALGAIGANAQTIRNANQLFTAPAGSAPGADLMAAGNRAALNLATGEAVSQAAAARLAGLQQLQTALNTAPNARAVLDLQARIQAEQAMIANDQMRLQGLAMVQAAQAQIQTQRDRERAAADSQARLALYQSGFQ
jgi:type IV secretion system protein VirB5